jgi:hypothetical protein
MGWAPLVAAQLTIAGENTPLRQEQLRRLRFQQRLGSAPNRHGPDDQTIRITNERRLRGLRPLKGDTLALKV